jgi:arginase
VAFHKNIQLIKAPSILGLKPTGVELMAQTLLENGLAEKLDSHLAPLAIEDLNHLYSYDRDPVTHCLNAGGIKQFSLALESIVGKTIDQGNFPFVLGGDCSALLGAMCALKAKGTYGLIFIDAHADFYEPQTSTTGEVADMDLAIVTGRGPEILINLNGRSPYVNDKHVIHLGQRDEEETKKYDLSDIRKTGITCYSCDEIKKVGIEQVAMALVHKMQALELHGLWIHFDTDVLSDSINPAVDYRLPGGLLFDEAEYLIGYALKHLAVVGITVTIYNPKLDPDGSIGMNITKSLGRAFQ